MKKRLFSVLIMAFLFLSFNGETKPSLWLNKVEGKVIQKIMINLDNSSPQETVILTNLKKSPYQEKSISSAILARNYGRAESSLSGRYG